MRFETKSECIPNLYACLQVMILNRCCFLLVPLVNWWDSTHIPIIFPEFYLLSMYLQSLFHIPFCWVLCKQGWTQAWSLHEACSLRGWYTITYLICPKKEMGKMLEWRKLRATGQWMVQRHSEEMTRTLRRQWEGDNMWKVGEGFLAEEEHAHRSWEKITGECEPKRSMCSRGEWGCRGSQGEGVVERAGEMGWGHIIQGSSGLQWGVGFWVLQSLVKPLLVAS